MALRVVEYRTFWELTTEDDALWEKCGRSRSLSDTELDYGSNSPTESVIKPCGTPTTASMCSSASSWADCSDTVSLGENENVRWGDEAVERVPNVCDAPALQQPPGKAQAPSIQWPMREPVNPWGSANVAACDLRQVPSEWTTLVLKRLPDGCDQVALVHMLTSLGFGKRFNFLYAPTNFRKLAVFGFCHVNFVTHEDAIGALEKLRSFEWAEFDGAMLEAHWSEPHQGLEVHIERYRNCPVMHRAVPQAYKPILLHNGRRIAFPKPTQSVYPPKDLSRHFDGWNA